MMMKNKSFLRAISASLAIVLLMACLPCSALAESFSAMVSAKKMNVSSDASGKKVLGSLPRNTVVTVKAVSGDMAYIKYAGRAGYARVSDMVTVDSVAEKAVTRISTYIFQQPNTRSARTGVSKGTGVYVLARKGNVAMVERNGVVGYTNLQHLILEGQSPDEPQQSAPAQEAKKAVARINTYVFQRPDTNSAYVKVGAGTGMYLLAVSGNIAKVKKNGVVGYTNLKHLVVEGEGSLDDVVQTPETPKHPSVPSFADAYKSGKYSNEQLCYLFLTQVMGYNTAAAAGVLANINYESGFRTTVNGDGGTSFGICQWHAGRKTRLLEYCKGYNVSADSLVGQLAYLKYELETFYPLVHNYLKGVENTAQGAYDAGYFFCWHFESPASREAQSVKRGQSGQNTYYGRYASI